MIYDPYEKHGAAVSDPARQAFPIVPNDTQPLAVLPKAIMAGTSGTLTLRAVDSPADVTLTVAAGQIVPLRAAYIRASGTTASAILGLA